jgi:hypothetical protein
MLELYNSTGNDDDTSYPICVNKITNTDALKKFMYMPFINRINNHRVIEFAGSGYMFRVYVSSHKKDDCIYQTMLKADGTLYMLHFSLQEIGTFKGSLPILVDLAKRFPNP